MSSTAIKKTQKYDASQIQVLEGLAPVRLRPGMYIGSTSSRGLHHLIWEVLDNSIDEHLAGFCQNIHLSVNKDGSITVEDDGRGMPVDKHAKGIPAERVIFTVLHAGGKFGGDSYKVSGGLHGVGASVVNALSAWLELEVYKDGFLYKDRFEHGGNPVIELENGELKPLGKTHKHGTKVTFLPDATIFETTEFKAEAIKKRLKELAYLNRNLTIHFKDERSGETLVFHEESGLEGFVKDLNLPKKTLHNEVVFLQGVSGTSEVEIAFQYTDEYTETILSFCNNINTIEGGTHVTGFKTALTRVLNQYARVIGVLKDKDENLDGRDIRNGITAVVSIHYRDPQFEGQTKTKLGNSDARTQVDDVFNIESQIFFDRNLETLKIILENALKSYRARKADEKAKANFLKPLPLANNDKLASCTWKEPEKIELFFVEGDSAGGSAKQGRDRRFQAILPLRGKVLNVEKSSLEKILGNTEITTMALEIGTGLGDDFDIKKLKYHKLIIMTDADVDGEHIRILILTFFYRYMPELIFGGYIYIGMPPLYKVTQGKKIQYLYTDKDLETFRQNANGKPFELQRYKGLGEMNPDQLWKTTMDPEVRLLKQVTIDDAVSADEVTNALMGSSADARRQFIYQEAESADLDI